MSDRLHHHLRNISLLLPNVRPPACSLISRHVLLPYR